MQWVLDWLSTNGPMLLSHGVLASLAALMGWRWWDCRSRLRAALERLPAGGVPVPFPSGTAPDGVPDGSAILEALLEGLPYRIFWKDRDLVYRGCNHLLARDAGRQTPDAVIGTTDHDLAWPREEARFYRQCDRQVQIGRASCWERV